MKKKHIYPTLRLNEEDLGQILAEEGDLRCLECGVKEVGSWATEGPVAPPVSSEMLARVRRKSRNEWKGHLYKIAAGFAVLILVLQLGKNQGIVTSDDPREATNFVIDSARNDTAFLLKDTPTEDTVKAVSHFEEEVEVQEKESTASQTLAILSGVGESGSLRSRVISTRNEPRFVHEEHPLEQIAGSGDLREDTRYHLLLLA